MTSLTLTVSLPLLTYNVPPGWTVSLVDTPGFGEANEYIQQLAEESVEVSAAYIYLLQTESIGGSEAKEMFASIAKKDQGINCYNVIRYCSMSPIIAVTKFWGGFLHVYNIKLHLQLFTIPSSFKITTINFKREVHTLKN